MSVPHLAQMLDCSTKTIERQIKAMQESRRYPSSVFLQKPRRVRVAEFLEFCERGI